MPKPTNSSRSGTTDTDSCWPTVHVKEPSNPLTARALRFATQWIHDLLAIDIILHRIQPQLRITITLNGNSQLSHAGDCDIESLLIWLRKQKAARSRILRFMYVFGTGFKAGIRFRVYVRAYRRRNDKNKKQDLSVVLHNSEKPVPGFVVHTEGSWVLRFGFGGFQEGWGLGCILS